MKPKMSRVWATVATVTAILVVGGVAAAVSQDLKWACMGDNPCNIKVSDADIPPTWTDVSTLKIAGPAE